MNRPQKFNPELGMQGNIEESLWENYERKLEIITEQGERERNDISNREVLEQQHTDSYLDMVEAQQTITDLQLQILELRGVSK